MFSTIGQSSHQQNRGVFVEYQESVKKSIQELVEIGVVPNSGNLNIRVKIKDGMDGAGHQLKIKGAEYPSMELFGYVLLKVYEISSSVSLLYSIHYTLGVAKIFRFTCTLFWSIPTYSIILSRSFSKK